MAQVLPTLVTSRNTLPGVFIGQLVKPAPSNLNADARLPVIIGRGSRFATGRNLPLVRSYISNLQLAFPGIAPFRATLNSAGDGNQEKARVFKQDGTEIRKDLWRFEKDGNGNFTKILIQSEVFDVTATYSIDYQSTDRGVRDPLPVTELRQILNMSTIQDQPKFTEFQDFFINMGFTGPVGLVGNTNALADIDLPIVVSQTGGGTISIDASSVYTHNYNRFYEVKCTAISGSSGSFQAVFEYAGSPISGGNNSAPGFPLNPAQARPVFTVDESVPASQVVELEFGVKVKFTFSATNFVVGDEWGINALGPALYETDARLSNTNQFVDQGTPVASLGNTGTGSILVAPGSSFIGLQNTNFKIQAFNVTNNFGSGSIAAIAKASYAAGETFSLGPITWQFDVSGSDVIVPGNVQLDISGATTDVDVANLIRIAINGSPLNIVAGDTTANVSLTAINAGTKGNYAFSETIANASFLGASMTGGDRSVDIVYQEYGDQVGISGTFTAIESNTSTLTQGLTDGVRIDIVFGVSNWGVGDYFNLSPKAPRVFTTIKDNRTYVFETNTATASLNSGATAGSFTTNTREGSFGSFISDSGVNSGKFSLPGNIEIVGRNLFKSVATGFENRHVSGDKHTLVVTNEETVSWDLTKKISQVFDVQDLITDRNGTITGVVGASYVILGQKPVSGTTKVSAPTTAPSFSVVTNSPFLFFVSPPTETITVTYDTVGEEPDPGQVYYMTANFLRPDELYNTPQLILSLDEGRKLLAPIEVDNHLAIANEIVWKNNPFGVYFIQVKDGDDDGVFTRFDFNTALLASEDKTNITDRIVLSNYASVSDQLAVNIKANDPFEKRESIDWFGLPIGTPIGDIDTEDSIVFTAQKTLQVFGNSPAHGTRVLIAATSAKTTVQLETGEVKQVTVDGSFVAAAVAAKVAGFNDPATTVLRKVLFGFDEIESFTDKENVKLVGAQTIFFADEGASVFRMLEDVTVDSLAFDFKLISGMTQKQFVTRVFRRELDRSVISFVIPTGQVGVDLITSAASAILIGMEGQGLIAPYQTDDGVERSFSPSTDVIVSRDTADITRFNIIFGYFLKTPIKRVFGLFSINSNDLTQGVPLNS